MSLICRVSYKVTNVAYKSPWWCLQTPVNPRRELYCFEHVSAMVNPPEGVVFKVVESFCISFGIQGCRVVRKACL